MTKKTDMNRRSFLAGTATAAAAFTIVPRFVLGKGQTPPSDTLNFAKVGCGGMGGGDYGAVKGAGARPVAGCDIDLKRGGNVMKDITKLGGKTYQDYRKMFDEMGKDIDAVVVSTPDHMHAPISLRAMAMGKHVYCQKPLAKSVGECYQMRDAAKKYGVVTQMGNQGHSGGGLEATMECIQAGVIGKVPEVHVWTDRQGKWWPCGPKVTLPKKKTPVPANIDWNLFLGVAPECYYSPKIHPFNWRGLVNFGAGAIGDMACHNMDPAFKALDLGQPTSVKTTCSEFNKIAFPAWSISEFLFPATKKRGPVKVVWYDGGKLPDLPEALKKAGKKLGSNGCLFVGEKGVMLGGSHARFCRPFLNDGSKVEMPPRTLPRAKGGHYKEWVESCKGIKIARGTCGTDFSYAAPMTATILTGLVGMYYPGETLAWDAKALAFKKKEANQYLLPTYRKDFKL